MQATILTFRRVVSTKRTRSFKNRCVMIDYYVVEYRDEQNNEYRKSFEAKPGASVHFPNQGTHQTINAAQYQWKE